MEEQWDGTEYTMDIDQPRMMMGFYIGMLATEYKLLKDNGQIASANATLSELNLALDALIRMDKCEDDIPWYYSYETMDGFFIREDIPAVLSPEMEIYFNQEINPNVSSRYQALNQPGLPTIIKGNHVRSNRRFEDEYSVFSLNPTWEQDWQNYSTGNPTYWEYWKRQKFVSQDELIGMMMGLALVVKCVDDQPTKNKAIDIGGKSVSYTLGNNTLTGSEYASIIASATGIDGSIVFTGLSVVDNRLLTLSSVELGKNWMRFPDNTIISDKSGGNTFAFSKGIVYSGRFITSGCENAYPEIYESLSGYQKAIWQLALNGLESNIVNQSSRNNMAMMSRLLAVSGLSDYRTLKHMGDYHKWDVFYLMVRAVLHDGDLRNMNFFNFGRLIDQLETAPCGGPYKFNVTSESDYGTVNYNVFPVGWATYLKFQTDVESQNGGHNHLGLATGYHDDDRGVFSGIDYMLLYNLACLAFPNGFDYEGQHYSFPYYINLNNRIISDAYLPIILSGPLSNVEIGSVASPEELRGISSISTDMIVSNQAMLYPNTTSFQAGVNGDVTLKAGESIKLTDGFRVDAGAHFLARIESYSCGGVSYKNMAAPPWDENYRGCFYDTLISVPMEKRAPIVYSEDNYEEADFDMPLWNDYYYMNDSTAAMELAVGAWLNPNPCGSSATLTFVSENEQQLTIELYDMTGIKRETVFNDIADQNLVLDFNLSSYASGTYMLRITGSGGVKVLRFVKE